ncbi:YisL family protein [Bacillus sp. FJAT-27245]|uniref:YisL family protein n=1 Tax=Bacillus sp. FJAT-27245 TaxID=1684144 RepID=UPI0006A776EB|nr:YisL family protein [Bacillus sp. FJAT-27245]
MTHAHITAWVLGAILFFVAHSMYKGGNQKGAKITHMILRVVYLLILATGFMMLFSGININLLYILKAAVGLWVIALMEFILMKTGKKEQTKVLWIQFAIAFILVLLLGFSLPMGFDWL